MYIPFVFISGLISFGVCIYIQYLLDIVRSNLQTIKKISMRKLIKRRSKAQEKNMSCEHALNFDQ